MMGNFLGESQFLWDIQGYPIASKGFVMIFWWRSDGNWVMIASDWCFFPDFWLRND
jgi:hypothetical protein